VTLLQLRQGHHPALDRPVITVKGREAKKLRRIIDEEKVARARIKSVSQLEEDPPKVCRSIVNQTSRLI